MTVSNSFRAATLSGLLAFAASAAAPVASAQSLQSFSGVVGGAGNGSIAGGCTTYGPPAELAFFGGFAAGISVLGGNAACGYGGGWTQLTSSSSTAPLLNSTSLAPTVLGNPGFAESFDGTAQSRASYGSLGATAHGNYSGSPASFTSGTTIAASVAAASFSDTLTASVSRTYTDFSTSGFVRYRFSLDGTMSTPGVSQAYLNGEALTALMLQQNGGPIYALMGAATRTGSTGFFSGAPAVGGGWTVAPGLVSGGSAFTSDLFAIDLTSSWNLKVGLIVDAFGNADNAFYNSARLVGIDLYDSLGQSITDFSLSAASGTDYLGTGPVAAVPEPSAGWLLAAGLLAGGVVRMRKARAARAASPRRVR